MDAHERLSVETATAEAVGAAAAAASKQLPPAHIQAGQSQSQAESQAQAQAPAQEEDEQDLTSAEAYEEMHVHSVYEAIAPHFSATRHKPWPLVETFLASQPVGSVGLDVGCGNGKYLPVATARGLVMLGSDRSASLVRLAHVEGRSSGSGGRGESEALVADGLSLPFPNGRADFAICIAVIHHLTTRERRVGAIASLLEAVRPGARVLVFVWALEQASSRRGWDEGSRQDTLVPWVFRAKKGEPGAGETFQRYYHLYKKGEVEEEVLAAGGHVVEAGYDRDNWWVICSKHE